MPKATAVWLVENTALTFAQIARFTSLHELEVQAIADGEVAVGMTGLNPIIGGTLTAEEIKRCEADEAADLQMVRRTLPQPSKRSKGPRYTPLAKRGDKPNAIAWLVKEYNALPDSAIVKLIGTTKSTIQKIRERSHWDMANIKPANPVLLGLCTSAELDAVIAKAGLTKHPAPEPEPIPEPDADRTDPFAGFDLGNTN